MEIHPEPISVLGTVTADATGGLSLNTGIWAGVAEESHSPLFSVTSYGSEEEKGKGDESSDHDGHGQGDSGGDMPGTPDHEAPDGQDPTSPNPGSDGAEITIPAEVLA